jgi:hypothetical protein
MWVWEANVVGLWSERAKLMDFAVRHRINRLYVQSQSLLSTPAGRAALARFIDAARFKGLSVELMFGNHDWALKAHHHEAVALVEETVAFTRWTPGARPVGVHFDVEPSTLNEWDTDRNGTAVQYLDLLDELKGALAGSGLSLAADFNFSYGHRDVTRNGKTRPLSQFIAAVVDRAVVMSYRDRAAGSNGIVDISSESVRDFTQAKKPLLIGVNTLCNRPDGQSFCTEGIHGLEVELSTVAAAEVGTSVAGFAIHDYAHYALLSP